MNTRPNPLAVRLSEADLAAVRAAAEAAGQSVNGWIVAAVRAALMSATTVR